MVRKLVTSLFLLLCLAVPVAAGALTWRPEAGCPGGYYLMDADRQVGYLWPEGDYYPLKAKGEWGPKGEPPVERPGPAPLTGVDSRKLTGKPRYTVNGHDVSRDRVIRLIGDEDGIEGDKIPDRTTLLRLTVIGPDATRAPVLADLQSHPSLAAYRDRLVVTDYAPDAWQVARYGFVTSGNPTVYLQQPDGTVLHRQDEYRGPEKLAEALRKADPKYDPQSDPDRNKSLSLPFDLSKIPSLVWILGAAAVVLLITNRKESVK